MARSELYCTFTFLSLLTVVFCDEASVYPSYPLVPPALTFEWLGSWCKPSCLIFDNVLRRTESLNVEKV